LTKLAKEEKIKIRKIIGNKSEIVDNFVSNATNIQKIESR